jgi:PhnB protein
MPVPKTKVHHIPAGYHAVTPYLIINNAAKALDWYKNVFGAREELRVPAPGGRVGHAEIVIGDSHIMLADEFPEKGYRGPQTLGGSASFIMIYVPDADAVLNKAKSGGAEVVEDIKDQFYGDRSATITDPFGHGWTIATHIEDVSPEELQRRMSQMKDCA